jgi:hypothetical protein
LAENSKKGKTRKRWIEEAGGEEDGDELKERGGAERMGRSWKGKSLLPGVVFYDIAGRAYTIPWNARARHGRIHVECQNFTLQPPARSCAKWRSVFNAENSGS